MANFVQGLAQLEFVGQSFVPQSFTSTAGGTGVLVYPVAPNLMSALMTVGAVNTLTSLVVKMQASTDNSNWDDISGAVFTTVTTATHAEIIDFQMPKAASTTADPYIYVRAFATLTGTAVLFQVAILGCKKYDGAAGYQAAPPTIN